MTAQTKAGSGLSVTEALGLYWRLRARGQSRVLARLSVEAQCSDLPLSQRRRLSRLLRESEAAST
jgi:hypothetical protein